MRCSVGESRLVTVVQESCKRCQSPWKKVVSLFDCEGMCSARQGRVKKRIEAK